MPDTICTACRGESASGCAVCNPQTHTSTGPTRCGCEDGRKCIFVSFCQVQDLVDTIAEQRQEIERLQDRIRILAAY